LGASSLNRDAFKTAQVFVAPYRVSDAQAFNPIVKNQKTKLSALSAEFNTMKAVKKLAVILSLGALVSAAFATTDEQAYLESCRKAPGVPLPVSVVAPTLGHEYSGAVVELEFVVDSTGQPTQFSVKSASDNTLATAVVDAVRQWKFKPALKNGVPVATKVALPVKVVDETLAMN
jgi:protein TonB